MLHIPSYPLLLNQMRTHSFFEKKIGTLQPGQQVPGGFHGWVCGWAHHAKGWCKLFSAHDETVALFELKVVHARIHASNDMPKCIASLQPSLASSTGFNFGIYTSGLRIGTTVINNEAYAW